MLLNIIYSIDSEHPVESCLWAKYYCSVKIDINTDFITVVNEHKEPNEQYLRYWHGSMIVLRPLFIFLNIEQIYLLNKILLYILALVLFIILFKKSKKIAIIFVISMFMISFKVVPYCLEYSWTFYIMLISSIISVLIEKKGNQKLYPLFMITGILTCFFDFLSTEIITGMVPILLVLLIRKEDNRLNNFKDGFKFLAISAILWGIGYIAMWFAKWIIASLILNINAMKYVKDNAMLRINGLQGLKTKEEMYIGALYNNWHNLYPINIVKNKQTLLIYIAIFFVLLASIIDWKNIKKKWFSILLLLIAITPYLRYVVFANHSYRHYFFTFRDQIISIIAILAIILEIINYNILFKKVEWRKMWKK